MAFWNKPKPAPKPVEKGTLKPGQQGPKLPSNNPVTIGGGGLQSPNPVNPVPNTPRGSGGGGGGGGGPVSTSPPSQFTPTTPSGTPGNTLEPAKLTASEATKQSLGAMGQNVKNVGLYLIGKDVTWRNPINPFRYTGGTRADEPVGSYVPPIATGTRMDYNTSGIKDPQKMTFGELEQTKIMAESPYPFILSGQVANEKLAADITAKYQSKVDMGALNVDEATNLANVEYSTKFDKLSSTYGSTSREFAGIYVPRGEKVVTNIEQNKLGIAGGVLFTIGSFSGAVPLMAVGTVLGMGQGVKQAVQAEDWKGRTLGLASASLATIGVGATASVFERQLFQMESSRIASQVGTPIKYAEYRFVADKAEISMARMGAGKLGIGSAKIDSLSAGAIYKPTPTTLTYGQTSITTLMGETSWNYNFGTKFVSLSTTMGSGKGMMLPGSTDKVGFSLTTPSGLRTSSISGVGRTYESAWGNALGSIPRTSFETGATTFGRAIKLRDNLVYGETYNAKAMGITTADGKQNWAILTDKTPSSRGFTFFPEVKTTLPTFGGGGSGSGGASGFSLVRGPSSKSAPTIMNAINTKVTPTQITFPKMTFSSSGTTTTSSKVMSSSLLAMQMPKLASETQQKTRTTTGISSAILNFRATNLDVYAGTRVRPMVGVGVGTTPSNINLTKLKLSPGIITGTRTPQPQPPIGNIDFTSIPPIALPKFNLGLTSMKGTRSFGAKARRKYTPSFGGLLGFKGFGIRPITKGFKWEFGKIKV